MKASEINKEAEKIIKQIFCAVLVNDDKKVWKKSMDFIDEKIYKLENWDRGSEMFIWKQVKWKMNNRYGKKFITSK